MALESFQLTSEYQLGNYQILRPLASGGMGEVYLATDVNLSRPTVIKIVKTEFASDQNTIERFFTEAKLMAKIESQNVASIYFFGELNNYPIIAMEYVNGRDLREVSKSFVFPEPVAYKILLQLVQGLKDIHNANVLHRDIKPENIKLQDNFVPKYLDFGIAKALDSSTKNLTEMNYKVGTPIWMAPELRYGAAENFQSDIWSLGCTAYSLLCGCHPFYGDLTDGEKIIDISPQALVNREYQFLAELKKQYSEKFLNIVIKMMELETSDRYKSCEEIESDLLSIKVDSDSIVHTQHIFSTEISNIDKVKVWLDRFKINPYQKRLIILEATNKQLLDEVHNVSVSNQTVAIEQNDRPTKELELKYLNAAKLEIEKQFSSSTFSAESFLQKSRVAFKTKLKAEPKPKSEAISGARQEQIPEQKAKEPTKKNIFFSFITWFVSNLVKLVVTLILLFLLTAFSLSVNPYTRSLGQKALEILPYSKVLLGASEYVSDIFEKYIQNELDAENTKKNLERKNN